MSGKICGKCPKCDGAAMIWELIPSFFICDSCGVYLTRSITGMKVAPADVVKEQIPLAVRDNDVQIDRARRRTQSLVKLESML